MADLPDIFKSQMGLAVVEAKQEIRACNEFTERFGLKLSEEEITELVQCRADALKR